jgi:ubiquinone/menaquinone biosynthesis C-methylase UbiE
MLSKFYDRYWREPDLYGMADLSFDIWTIRRVKMFLECIPPGQRIADIGCGTGGGAQLMQNAGHMVKGIDISPAAIEEARRRHPDISFLCCSLEDGCPLSDHTFDAVFCGEVIEHIYDVPRFLTELYRLLRPKGILAITTPYHGVFKNLLIAIFRFDKHFDPCGPHIRFFTVKSLKYTLEKSGFRIQRVGVHGRVPPISNGMFVLAIRQP